MSELELCPTRKKGKFRATAEVSVDSESDEPCRELSSVRELVCDYCGQKRSNVGLNEYV